MILQDHIAQGVRTGEVTRAYRRWAKVRIKAGSTFRSTCGVVRVESIEQVALDDLDDADARKAGHENISELSKTLRGDESDPVWRIELSWAGPDPREELASATELAAAEIREIESVLEKVDGSEPWTGHVLDRLHEQPGVTAAVLAAELDLDKAKLKRRIRTLKEHGLTRSLAVGYALSPRGKEFQRVTKS